MTHERSDDPQEEDSRRRWSDRSVAILTVEGIAFAIALVSPVTPTRTGSTWSPAELVTADPTYLQKVVAAFASVHVIFLVIGLVAWIAHRLGGTDGPGAEA